MQEVKDPLESQYEDLERERLAERKEEAFAMITALFDGDETAVRSFLVWCEQSFKTTDQDAQSLSFDMDFIEEELENLDKVEADLAERGASHVTFKIARGLLQRHLAEAGARFEAAYAAKRAKGGEPCL
jgi:hypothetical protein